MSSIIWKELKAPNAPLARSSHGVSVVGDTLFMFGGEHSARDPIGTELHSLDLARGRWTEVEVQGAARPPPRFGHTQVSVGKSVYVFGGREGISTEEKLLNDLWAFDTDSKTWTEVEVEEKGSAPAPRSFHSSVVAGEYIYIFGGCSAEGRQSDLHRFDTTTKRWKKLATGKMSGRGGTPLAATTDGSAIYVLGGFAGTMCDGEETADVHRYDIAGDTWSEVETALPEALSVALAFSRGDKIILYGGEIKPSERGHAGAGNFSGATTVFSEDTSEKNLKLVERLAEGGPPARGWSAGATWGVSKFVSVGGLAGDDENPLRLMDVWILWDWSIY